MKYKLFLVLAALLVLVFLEHFLQHFLNERCNCSSKGSHYENSRERKK